MRPRRGTIQKASEKWGDFLRKEKQLNGGERERGKASESSMHLRASKEQDLLTRSRDYLVTSPGRDNSTVMGKRGSEREKLRKENFKKKEETHEASSLRQRSRTSSPA